MSEKMTALILAAGKGKRMASEKYDLPKVMRSAYGRPLLSYVLENIGLGIEDVVIVAGYKKEKVMEAFPEYCFTVQEEQLGTGHAVLSAKEELKKRGGAVLVCCGDMPLVSKESYSEIMKVHKESGNCCTILAGVSDEELPYGRIVRDENGRFMEIVETKDCTEEQKNIRELNSGVYVFEVEQLIECLGELKNDNAQSEYYLTDVPALMRKKGYAVDTCRRELGDELIGVNTPEQLEQVEQLIKNKK